MKGDIVDAVYFEPGRRFTAKRLLAKNILSSLNGDLRIVDPYCGERTLDILDSMKGRRILFLTKIENLSEKERGKFLRELKDFKSEHTDFEFRNYPRSDIHDRYIISSDSLVIIGHSMKDLGSKESFAIVLNKPASKDIADALTQNFDKRWGDSSIL